MGSAAVVGEDGRAGHDGQRQRVDERVGGQVGHGRSQIGEHRLRRVDRKEAAVLVRLHVLHFKHADKARQQVEGLGGFLRALDLALKDHDVDLGIFVRVADLPREQGLDLELCVGLCLDGVDLERELFRGQRFQGIFDHDYTSLNSSFPLFYHAESGLSTPFSRRVGPVMKLMKKSVLFFVKTLAFSGEKHIIQARKNPVGALCAKGASWTKQKA